jgi:hypothetical protein
MYETDSAASGTRSLELRALTDLLLDACREIVYGVGRTSKKRAGRSFGDGSS